MTTQETTAASTDAPTNLVRTIAQRRGVRQFIKFCIVGLSSTLIDFGAGPTNDPQCSSATDNSEST